VLTKLLVLDADPSDEANGVPGEGKASPDRQHSGENGREEGSTARLDGVLAKVSSLMSVDLTQCAERHEDVVLRRTELGVETPLGPLTVADGPLRIAETSVPVLNVRFSADEGTFPTETAIFSKAAGKRCEDFTLTGARHFPFKQKNGAELVATLADKLVDWTTRAT